jgi:hypothetical protein
MSNHIHLLLKTNQKDIGSTIKPLAVTYAMYYNNKYSRSGHVFQDRFKSEPVNDMEYFTVLLRYIHQSPLKAGIVEKVKDYEYSSWGEYQGTVDPAFQICDIRTVLNRIPLNALEAWVNDPLPNDYNFLDNDNEKPRLRLSDDQVWQEIIKFAGVTCSSDFQKLERQLQRETLGQLRELGASVRQLERLTGISRGVIQFVRK